MVYLLPFFSTFGTRIICMRLKPREEVLPFRDRHTVLACPLHTTCIRSISPFLPTNPCMRRW